MCKDSGSRLQWSSFAHFNLQDLCTLIGTPARMRINAERCRGKSEITKCAEIIIGVNFQNNVCGV